MKEIRFNNVCKYYKDNSILNKVDIVINKSEFITVLGPSGCGKTTFLKLINKLEKYDCGKIYIENECIDNIDTTSLRRKIGYVLQSVSLFPHLTIRENIMYVPNLLKKTKRDKLNIDIEGCLKIVNLDKKLLDRYPDELSGGQSQRVAIARALIFNPEIILMDEPFSAVDEITRKKMQQEIKKIHNKTQKTIIFVTHDVKEAFILGDRVLILNKGTVEQFDTPDNIIKNPNSDFVSELISSITSSK